MSPNFRQLKPLLMILCLLLPGFFICLPHTPLIDTHPEWRSVWNKAHLAVSRGLPWAYLIDFSLALVAAAMVVMVRLCMQKIAPETLIMGLFACLLIYHLGWKLIPYNGNGLHHAAMPISSGFYDPKTLPPMNGIMGYIWGMGLFCTEMMMMLLPVLLIYRLIKKRPGIFVLAILQLCIAHALLQTLTPNFWVWFMD